MNPSRSQLPQSSDMVSKTLYLLSVSSAVCTIVSGFCTVSACVVSSCVVSCCLSSICSGFLLPNTATHNTVTTPVTTITRNVLRRLARLARLFRLFTLQPPFSHSCMYVKHAIKIVVVHVCVREIHVRIPLSQNLRN